MRQLFNIVRGREYESREGMKTTWDRVGVLVVDGEKVSLRLDTIPAGQWDGWLKAFPRDDERRPANGARPAPRGGGAFDDLEDDVPF
jgi:hypothetical protein